MNDEAVDALVRSRARVDDATVESWDLDSADLEVLDHIQAEPIVVHHRPSRRRRLTGLAASIIAVTGVIAAVIIAGPGSGENAYATDVLASAEKSPRILIDDPAWKVVTVDEWSESAGEMLFSDGAHQVQVNWYRAGLLEDYITDRENSGAKRNPSRLFGRASTTMLYDGKPGEILGLVNDRLMVDVAFDGNDESAYSVLVAKLRTVGAEKWLNALPASVFSGNRRNLAIDGLLAGVPLPPGYDPGLLKQKGFVSDRYQLGAAVVADVGCAWFDRWFDARNSHDRAAADAAGRALRGSHDWPVLKEMAVSGGYSQVFWGFADATKDGVIHGGGDSPLTPKRLVNAIGCQ